MITKHKVRVLRARRIRLDLCRPYEERCAKEKYIARYKAQNLGNFPPIAVSRRDDGAFEIVNGHHRYYARKDLGYKYIMAWILPNNHDGSVEVLWRGRVFTYDETMWARDTHRNSQSKSRPVDNMDVLV